MRARRRKPSRKRIRERIYAGWDLERAASELIHRGMVRRQRRARVPRCRLDHSVEAQYERVRFLLDSSRRARVSGGWG